VTVTEEMIIRAIDQSSAVLKKIESNTRKVTRAQKENNKTAKEQSVLLDRLRRTASNVNATFTLLSRGLGVMKVAFGGTIGAAIVFEKSIAEVATLTEASVASTDALARSVASLATQYGADLNTTAKALYQIISAGATEAADANKILETSLILALGGVTSVDNAADGLTTIMNAYGKSADDATQISDVLFSTMKAGKTTVGELTKNLGFIVSIASTAGVSFEELSAAIAVASKVQGNAKRPVIGLRQAISSLQKPSKEAAEEAKRLGIHWSADALAALGLTGVLRQLEGNVKLNRDSLGKLVGNIRAASSVSAILAQGVDELSDQFEKNKDSSGAAADAAEIMSNTTAFAMDRLNSAFSRFNVEMGNTSKGILVVLDDIFNLTRALNRTAVLLDRMSRPDVDPFELLSKNATTLTDAQGEANNLLAKFVKTPGRELIYASEITQLKKIMADNSSIIALLDDSTISAQRRADLAEFSTNRTREELPLLQKRLKIQEEEIRLAKLKAALGAPGADLTLETPKAATKRMLKGLKKAFSREKTELRLGIGIEQLQDFFPEKGLAELATLNAKSMSEKMGLEFQTSLNKIFSTMPSSMKSQVSSAASGILNTFTETVRKNELELIAPFREAFTQRLAEEAALGAKGVTTSLDIIGERLQSLADNEAKAFVNRLRAGFQILTSFTRGITVAASEFQNLKSQGVKTAVALRVSFAQAGLQIIDTIMNQILANTINAAIAAASSQAAIPLIGPVLAAAAAATTFGVLKAFATRKLSEGISMQHGGEVPQIPGSVPGRDSVLINAAPGERMLTVEENRQDKEGRRGGGGDTINLNLSLLTEPDRVQIDRLVRDVLEPSRQRIKRRGGRLT